MEWKVSISCPEYEVSEFGDVRRCVPTKHPGRAFGNPLSPRISFGYKCFNLVQGSGRKFTKASRLVAEAFIGPAPFEGAQACHGDGNKLHNHYSNLRWDTGLGNQADRISHGTHSRGEKNGQCKLSVDSVIEICRMTKAGASLNDIASKFNISRSNVSNIVTGKRWANI